MRGAAQRTTTAAGWAALPFVSMMTLLPLLVVRNQFAVTAFLGKLRTVSPRVTAVMTVRWVQRAVPEDRTHILPLALASYVGWAFTTCEL